MSFYAIFILRDFEKIIQFKTVFPLLNSVIWQSLYLTDTSTESTSFSLVLTVLRLNKLFWAGPLFGSSAETCTYKVGYVHDGKGVKALSSEDVEKRQCPELGKQCCLNVSLLETKLQPVCPNSATQQGNQRQVCFQEGTELRGLKVVCPCILILFLSQNVHAHTHTPIINGHFSNSFLEFTTQQYMTT